MKKNLISVISLMLILVMLLGVLASCQNYGNTRTDTNSETTETTETTETDNKTAENTTETDNKTEESTVEPTVELEGKDADLIQYSNSIANGVQAYFTDSKRTHFSIKNLEMTMNYNRNNDGLQMVESIKNTKGSSYVENTMDVFVRMTDGKTYYSSGSSSSSEVNLYRFGYYYYEGLFEFQNFIPGDLEVSDVYDINIENYALNAIRAKRNQTGITLYDSGNDPFFYYKDLDFDPQKYNAITFTAKVIGDDLTSGEVFVSTNGTKFNNTQKVSFAFIPDGETHTYTVSLASMAFDGNISAIRIDFGNSNDMEGIELYSFGVGHVDVDNMPLNVSINRHFHVYSDKMHHAIQFATTKETNNVAQIGMLTQIPADTVEKLIVVDNSDKTYSTIEGIDWTTVVAVAFDIKDAGIFGYILPKDDASGNIEVKLIEGTFVIEQTRIPTGNTLLPSIGDKIDANGNYTHAEGVKNNGNDVYLGQRIYTDENHSFDEFLYETYCERYPLTENFIKISQDISNNASFDGYDAVRGIYVISVGAPNGFSTAYNNPQKHYKASFTIMSKDIDRSIYVMSSSRTSGSLECAVILNDDMLHLPVPVEVIKNFSEPEGERNLFNIDDPAFSEAIFALKLNAGEKKKYSIVNLYQNWGNYPLKQISSIPFHCPYYHLSTGTTETNCILPWFNTDIMAKSYNTLPDFRSMSAPFWSGQPQHNSAGSNAWLQYTDADGKFVSVENTSNFIDSYGPTYAEVIMDNISDDGKIKVTYTHMEMPQLDENRTYYTMNFEVLEDITIKDFKNNFQFFRITDNDPTGRYQRIGYLNENNEYAVASAVKTSSDTKSYILGDECPYFSMYDMIGPYDKETNPEGYSSESAEGYANVAFFVYNSEFIIGGEKVTPSFIIHNTDNKVRVSLDLGDVTLKAGDKMTINCILLPWGSQEMDGTYDEIQDKNAREVRENTLLDPLKVTSDTDEIIDSVYVPRVKSKDGKSAEFTLSGGHNNVAVRVYGFNMLTAPKIEEYVNGEWQEYVVSSKDDPVNGYYHYYDGYGVHYDGDGTYSYSFVTTMDNGAPRRFRISADTEFGGWPIEIPPVSEPDILKAYTDAEELNNKIIGSASQFFNEPKLSEDGKYVTISPIPNLSGKESYVTVYRAETTEHESGQYLAIKYRVPSTNAETLSTWEIFASTENTKPTEGDNFFVSFVQDGEWHVLVIDLSKTQLDAFIAKDDVYCVQYLRIDFFNRAYSQNPEIDIEYVGIDSSLEEICDLNAEEFETVTLYDGTAMKEISTTTYTEADPEPPASLLDESSLYKESELAYGSYTDSLYTVDGKVVLGQESGSAVGYPTLKTKFVADADGLLKLSGWCIVDGGISKYVWTADGGKTWNDMPSAGITPTGDNAEAIKEAGNRRAGGVVTDLDASVEKASFQGSAKMVIDLSVYIDATEPLCVIIGAVPVADAESVCILYVFANVTTSN